MSDDVVVVAVIVVVDVAGCAGKPWYGPVPPSDASKL